MIIIKLSQLHTNLILIPIPYMRSKYYFLKDVLFKISFYTYFSLNFPLLYYNKINFSIILKKLNKNCKLYRIKIIQKR